MKKSTTSKASFLQSTYIVEVGSVQCVSIQEQGVHLITENASIQLLAYSPNVVRVRISRQQPSDDFSYAVMAQPTTTEVVVSDHKLQLGLSTAAMSIHVDKLCGSIGFYTLDHTPINVDEPGLPNSWVEQTVTAYKHLQEGERFIGLGEKCGGLDKYKNAYTNWNSDKFAYGTDEDPLYTSFPFYIGLHHGLCYGIFLDNSYQADFNFGASNNRFSSFGARGGELNYYFIHHTSVAEIIASYTALTGRMPLPPLWSLGYQQNRYSYYPDTEVIRIAQTLREKRIPADGITLDIHYMEGYKLFTWDKDRFPHPRQLTDQLKEMGFKTTVIVDPGIKVEQGYGAYERGCQADIFVKYPDGTNYSGQVWPGWCHFPDFTAPEGRAWWMNEMDAQVSDGIDGVWNDMNEIATWGQRMPDNLLFDYDGHTSSHLKAHNIYALQMARASYEGFRHAKPENRPFLLTRAGYAGIQRYSAVWTGDNCAEEDHLLMGIRMMMGMGLTGVAFTGMDVGGFVGEATTSLYARWMQVGAFTPYLRNHSQVNTRSSEPWSFGEEVLEICRNYINLRYRLLPYLYACFHEATQNGLPIMRTLAIDSTFEPEVFDPLFENQYLFGPAFLVAPFQSTEKYGEVYFPASAQQWYNLYNDQADRGGSRRLIPLHLHQLPVFVKAGSIVPMQLQVQHTAEPCGDTLFVHLYKGDTANSFVYYEDDGQTYEYLRQTFHQRTIRFDPANKQLVFEAATGGLASKYSQLKVYLHGYCTHTTTNSTVYLGKRETWTPETLSFIQPISNFNPQGLPHPAECCTVISCVVMNSMEKMMVDLPEDR